MSCSVLEMPSADLITISAKETDRTTHHGNGQRHELECRHRPFSLGHDDDFNSSADTSNPVATPDPFWFFVASGENFIDLGATLIGDSQIDQYYLCAACQLKLWYK